MKTIIKPLATLMLALTFCLAQTALATNVTLKVIDSQGNPLSGIPISIHKSNVGGQGTYSTNISGEITVDLANYTFNGAGYAFTAKYQHSSSSYSQAISSGDEGQLIHTFQTVEAKIKVATCGGDPVENVPVSFFVSNSGGGTVGNTNASGEASTELFAGTHTFTARLNKSSASAQVNIAPTGVDHTFNPTVFNWNYGGTVKYWISNSGGGTITPGFMLFAGTYDFTFYDGSSVVYQTPITVSGCEMTGNIYVFKTLKADGSALPNIDIRRNDYGSHYVNVGTTDANGYLFATGLPAGSWKYQANKNYSDQHITSGPGYIQFQTAKYTAHVKKTDGSDFAGIETEYNDYGSHWIDLDPTATDANGNASIELFPGDFKFRAKKNYSVQENTLELTNPGDMGTVEFQTSTFTAHVTKHDGSDFEGIETEYNDYGSHWIDLDPTTTDASGNASIELFPGDFKFRAKKNYSVQENTLEILTSGTTDVVEFQTALAIAHVKDCDLNTDIAGIQVEYNDYGSHWIDLDPSSTGADGKASIELFPGTFDLRAKNIYTVQTKPIVLTHPTTTVEFNPTRVCFNYDLVKYNDYGSHWINLPCNTYMFPGTYNFRFYTGSTIDLQTSVAISGCSQEQAPIFVQLRDSEDNGLANGEFNYRFGYDPYTTIGTDATGDGIWFFIPGNPGNTKVRVAFKGTALEIQQNVQSNPMFIFNTVKVTADLQESDSDDITGDATWQYRYGYDPYSSFDPVAGEELLPVNTKVRVSFKGTAVEQQQNVGSNSHFDFNTVKVTADLQESDNDDITGDATWQYRYGYDPYTSFDAVAGVELLPVNTKVRVSHKGTSDEKQQNVSSNSHFDFNTVKVTADLQESDNDDITGGATFQYRFGYDPYSSLDPVAGEELLPGNTKVRVSYKGASVENQQNTGTASHFDFNTVNVTATLMDGASDVTGSATWQYRYGYDPYSPFDPAGEELLPVNTKVQVSYLSLSDEKQQNVGSASHYDFEYDGSTIKRATANAATHDKPVLFYPNPTSSQVTIEADGEIIIHNLSGKLMYMGGSETIDVSNWAAGLYFIKANGESFKLIVE